MKITILFSTLLMGLSSLCYSQTEKGKKVVGGNFSISGNNSSSSDSLQKGSYLGFGYSLNPNAGYFIIDNLAVGIIAVYGSSQSKSESEYSGMGTVIKNTSTDKGNNYGGGIFAKYYKKVGEKLSLILDGDLMYNHYTSESEDTYFQSPTNTNVKRIRKNQGSSFGINISPGIAYFPSSKISFQATMGRLYYTKSTSKNLGKTNNNVRDNTNYGFNINLNSFSFGLSYYF